MPWSTGKITAASAAALIPLFFSIVIGFLLRPGVWYRSLRKPWYMPPGWVFAVVWTVLYPLIGVAMIAACYGTDHPYSWIAPVLNIILSFLFPIWMFGLHSLVGGALITYLCLLLGIVVTFQYHYLNHSMLAVWLMIPYVVWLVVANILAFSIWKLNRGCDTTGSKIRG